MAKKGTIIRNDTVTISMERKNGKLVIENSRGDKWTFPKHVTERVALASMVFGAMFSADDINSMTHSHYRVSITVTDLDYEE